MIEKILSRCSALRKKVGFSSEMDLLLESNLSKCQNENPKDLTEIASIIDHSNLRFDATLEDITILCKEAHDYDFKAICINPCFVEHAYSMKKDLNASFKIASVIDFPLGCSTTKGREEETNSALKNGAEELDLVASIGLLKSHKYSLFLDNIKRVTELGAYTKVILEMSILSMKEQIDATILSIAGGCDMLKTSTGVNGQARVEDVVFLKKLAGNHLEVKAAGGIKTLDDLYKMVQAGADRIGCSNSITIMEEFSSRA